MADDRRFDILMVDDRPENLMALEAALSGLGQNIVQARSGKEALRKLLHHEFVVILLDVNMPDMDGFETATLIRQRRKTASTPIIFVTAAMSSDTHLARGYALGAVDYLFIPIDPEILRSKVSAFIDLAKRSESLRARAEEERAAAEKRASLLETRMQSLMNRLDVGIFRSTPDGRLLEANPALLRLLGVNSIGEARDGSADSAGPAGIHAILSLRGDDKLQEQIVEIARADGASTWVSVTKALGDGSGGPCVEGFVTDITRRKHSEEEREELLARERAARSDAEIANRVKDEFLATLSHELRTPLNAILGWAQVLRETANDQETIAPGLEAIERNARSQTRLIDDLLDMSRIMSGKIRLDIRRVELAALIDGVIESHRPAAEAKGIRLSCADGIPERPLSVDPVRLQQVLSNLVANSIKFTPGSGTVTISCKGGPSSVTLSVSDDGQGIAADFLPHLFERFRQADASSTRRHGGLGLGLAIVKNLVEMHGGEVHASSDGVGKGSRFDVVIPWSVRNDREAATGSAPAAAAAKQSSSGDESDRPRLDGLRVLAVDDVEDARELLKRILEDRGAVVRTAESVPRALEMFEQEVPDILLGDIAMADFDGYYLISRIRALPPEKGGQVPAVAITSFARAEDRTRALEAGYDDHLSKPMDPWRLLKTIAALTRRSTAASSP